MKLFYPISFPIATNILKNISEKKGFPVTSHWKRLLFNLDSLKREDADKDLGKYRKRLSRSDEEIKDMNSPIETALKRIDKTMEAMG